MDSFAASIATTETVGFMCGAGREQRHDDALGMLGHSPISALSRDRRPPPHTDPLQAAAGCLYLASTNLHKSSPKWHNRTLTQREHLLKSYLMAPAERVEIPDSDRELGPLAR